MPRSVKKGPFIDKHLVEKIEQQLRSGQKKSIKS